MSEPESGKISRRKLITTGLAAAAGVSALGVAAGVGAEVWASPARSQRNLGPRRDAELRFATAADAAFAGA